MVAPVDISGQRFGRLVAIRCIGSDCHGKRVWETRCDCGRVHKATSNTLRRGCTTSCGCKKQETAAANAKAGARKIAAMKTKHGHAAARTPEYAVWKTMRQRCSNSKSSDYPSYGGRGIIVCDRWDDFGAFLDDMGRRPSEAHSIDRIDANGNYDPANCRWATAVEQANNRRPRGTGEQAIKRGQQ